MRPTDPEDCGRGATADARFGADRSQTTTSHIKQVAGEMHPDEIAKAKVVYHAGTITDAEYESLKHRALVRPRLMRSRDRQGHPHDS